MKKMLWLWKIFWGKKYNVKFTSNLEENFVLFFNHTIYIGVGKKQNIIKN